MNIRLAPQCPKCSYSLRGLAGEGVLRCPECGTALAQHHFAGLYRVRSMRAWIVTACAPVILAAAVMAATARLLSGGGFTSPTMVMVVASSVIVCVAAVSGGMTLALAGVTSQGCPRIIRDTNHGWALLAVMLLGMTTIVAVIFTSFQA